MNALVTGGAGFIGSNLVRALVSSGVGVRVLDNESTGSRGNLSDVADAIEYLRGDIRSKEDVSRAIQGAEVVFHLAALPSVARSVADPVTSNDVNVGGTVNVLACAVEAGVARVVYASSSSVYGDTPVLPKHEEMPPTPRSPYAASKLAGEAYCRSFAHAYGVQTVALRFFNIFGPRQDPASEYAAVVPRFVASILTGEAPVVFGDGGQTRDFTFVANAVQACLLAAQADPVASGQAMNVGCGGRFSLLDLVDVLGGLVDRRIQPRFEAPRPGDVRDSQADITKAERLLGYRPSVEFREGVQATVEWFFAASGAEGRISAGRGG